MDFGKRIKERRIELRMTQQQVGEMAGVDYVTVLHVEKNKKCAFETVQKICEALRLEITLTEYEKCYPKKTRVK